MFGKQGISVWVIGWMGGSVDGAELDESEPNSTLGLERRIL
jgi:hypothetical protein